MTSLESQKKILKQGYSAYVLTESSRTHLLHLFPPQFTKVISHHVTYQFPDDCPPPFCQKVKVIGYSTTSREKPVDDYSIECVVAQVADTHLRPDGSTFHITLSLMPQTTRPVHSNDLLKRRGWTHISTPFMLEVDPQWISF